MRKSKEIICGGLKIGGGAPLSIQSMTNTDTRDSDATVGQILELEKAGCQIIRLAIVDETAAQALREIKKRIHIPMVADIHFDYRLAIASIENGADKIRINPGNIGGYDRVKAVVDKAKEYQIPIRIGVNSGSLPKDLLRKYKGVCAEALVESALREINLIEGMGYTNLVISLKSSSVKMNYDAHKIIAEKMDYPLHIGITESGTIDSGKIKSAVGIGALLLEGIGDTLRVSLTGNPLEEIRTALEILKAAEIRKEGINIISCPTCGRTHGHLEKLALSIENRLKGLDIKEPITVAIMGCEVNGPGEAREADIGIACGKNKILLFKKGEIIESLHEENVGQRIVEEVMKISSRD
ncbi:MAG: flavodoxin-dependent (E)-4-hydroxy-3-methylbut-2-enyl-diphosphate synthase [Peptostreptococcales bacterium]